MILAFILVVGAVCAIAGAGDGNWWVVLMAIGIVSVVIGMCALEREDAKAYNNCRTYWANGGPEGKRRR